MRILYRYVPTSVLSKVGNSRECKKEEGREEDEDGARTRSAEHTPRWDHEGIRKDPGESVRVKDSQRGQSVRVAAW